jgi:predicted AlkP superfamily phosphohydrolase/phosphomutase
MPFWRMLSRQGARVAAIDMPFAPPPDAGIELCGWSTLDSLEPARAHPPELLAEVRASFGAGVPRSEIYAQQPAAELLALRDEHVRIAESLASLAERLLRRDRFDLFTLCLPGPHRCGHRLWDDSGLKGAADAAIRTQLADALAAVYRASDEALGRVLEAAGADEILVYTVHGMGPNTSRVEILDDMLTRVLGPPGGRSGGHAATARLRAAVPPGVRDRVKRHLPTRWQDQLTGFWRTAGRDWSTVPAVSLVADLGGYVRLNRAGREAAGILSPSAADEIAERIADGLATFVDADTGEPVVHETVRIERLLPDGPARDLLPDLIVDWAGTPAAWHRQIVSPRHGAIPWPTPGRHPSGRSGNHRGEGFYVALGSGLAPGTGPAGDILDLAPTVLARLGAEVPTTMRGHPLLGPGGR